MKAAADKKNKSNIKHLFSHTERKVEMRAHPKERG